VVDGQVVIVRGVVPFGLADLDDPDLAVGGAVGPGAARDGHGERLVAGFGLGGDQALGR
jgi:hypothetical protein